MNGPMVGEEILGACFVIDEIEIADPKSIDYLMKLLKEIPVSSPEAPIEYKDEEEKKVEV
jgi:hypothetical protein